MAPEEKEKPELVPKVAVGAKDTLLAELEEEPTLVEKEKTEPVPKGLVGFAEPNSELDEPEEEEPVSPNTGCEVKEPN